VCICLPPSDCLSWHIMNFIPEFFWYHQADLSSIILFCCYRKFPLNHTNLSRFLNSEKKFPKRSGKYLFVTKLKALFLILHFPFRAIWYNCYNTNKQIHTLRHNVICYYIKTLLYLERSMCITSVYFVTTLLHNQHVDHVSFKTSCLELDVILAAGFYSSWCKNITLEFVSSSWFRDLSYSSANATI
jgi:hypothetical protein